MEKRYQALITVSSIYTYVSVFVFVAGVLFGGYVFIAHPPSTDPRTGIAIIVGSVFAGLALLATGEALSVLVALEANTRKTAYLLEQQFGRRGEKKETSP